MRPDFDVAATVGSWERQHSTDDLHRRQRSQSGGARSHWAQRYVAIGDRPMDFKTLNLSGASDTSAWGPQFHDEGEEDMLSPIDLGGGHLVLARRSADVSELRH